jgi:hypothetical protein
VSLSNKTELAIGNRSVCYPNAMRTPKSTPVESRFRFKKTHVEAVVWKAIEPVECYQCGRTVEVGELFTRSADKKGKVYGIRYTNCRDCVPFEPSPRQY